MPKPSRAEYEDEFGNLDGNHPQAQAFIREQEKKRREEKAKAAQKQQDKAAGDYPIPDEETLEKYYSPTAPFEVSKSMYEDVFQQLKHSNGLFNIMRFKAGQGKDLYYLHGSGDHSKVEHYKTEAIRDKLDENYQAEFDAAFEKKCKDYGLNNKNEEQREDNYRRFSRIVGHKLKEWAHKEAEAKWFISMGKYWAHEGDRLKKEFGREYGLPKDFSIHK